MNRPEIIELLNAALSAEYNSFLGHALASNPYVAPEWEKDLAMLEELREEENDLSRALLVQFGRYRAGPTLKAFALWKEDLNFLSLEWLIIRAADEAQKNLDRAEDMHARLPDDAELRATFDSIVRIKKKHLERLSKAAKRMKEGRDARRATHRAVTAVKVPGLAAPTAGKPKAAPAAAPKSGGGKAPPLPGGFKLPPGAPKPPGAPEPPGAPKAPPLPPGAKPPGAPTPPSDAPAKPAAPEKKESPGHPPLPPGFKLPGK